MTRKRAKKNVSNIKNYTAEDIHVVHKWTFIIFEAVVYIAIDRWFLARYLENNLWCEMLRAVVFAVGYMLINMLVKKAYNRIIVYRHPKLKIEGEWYHVHIPNSLSDRNEFRESISAGTTTVSRKFRDFTFVASNYRYTFSDGKVLKLDTEANTEWWTEVSEYVESNEFQIAEIYTAKTKKEQNVKITKCPVCERNFTDPRCITEATKRRYGIHLYSIKDRENMVCEYSDCWPSLKSGTLYFYKSKEKRDKKIKEFFYEQNKKYATK